MKAKSCFCIIVVIASILGGQVKCTTRSYPNTLNPIAGNIIYGNLVYNETVIDSKQLGLIQTTCYSGLGLKTCNPVIPDDDYVQLMTLAYYYSIQPGSQYCLQCCSSSLGNVDRWNISCATDPITKTTSNVYNYEFRFAKRGFLGDAAIIKCPLPRTGCNFITNSCSQMLANGKYPRRTYLHGYVVTLHISMLNINFQFWNSITGCEATAIEKDYPMVAGEHFHESFVMVHHPVFSGLDDSKLIFLSFLVFLILFVALYFCRRDHCIVCRRKLIFSPRRCFMCQFVGAYPPDPVLLRALEEKTRLLQGAPPSRLPMPEVKEELIEWAQVVYGTIFPGWAHERRMRLIRAKARSIRGQARPTGVEEEAGSIPSLLDLEQHHHRNSSPAAGPLHDALVEIKELISSGKRVLADHNPWPSLPRKTMRAGYIGADDKNSSLEDCPGSLQSQWLVPGTTEAENGHVRQQRHALFPLPLSKLFSSDYWERTQMVIRGLTAFSREILSFSSMSKVMPCSVGSRSSSVVVDDGGTSLGRDRLEERKDESGVADCGDYVSAVAIQTRDEIVGRVAQSTKAAAQQIYPTVKKLHNAAAPALPVIKKIVVGENPNMLSYDETTVTEAVNHPKTKYMKKKRKPKMTS